MSKSIKSKPIPKLPNRWEEKLDKYWPNIEKLNLLDQIQREYNNNVICPEINKIWRAYSLTPPNNVRVVILGQDPYPDINQANGLSFSVNPGVKIPPSLKNIFKLYVSDTGFCEPKNGDLSKWALEGVFLLNSCLTVKSGEPRSHSNLPYHRLLEATIYSLNDSQNNIVFWLLGREAQSYEKFIDSKKHFCLKTYHPSPLSAYRGFFDSKLFIKTDEYFQSKNSKGVNWRLDR